MELQITDETLRKNLSEAILASIGQASRQAIVKEAIADLCAVRVVKTNPYSNKTEERPSKLQELFANAVQAHARDIIADLVENDDQVRVAVDGFVRKACAEMFSDKFPKLPEAMANALGAALSRADW